MKAKLAELKQREAEVLASPHHQVSLTDPDSRSMATSHDIGMVGYNMQSAVDTEHHLIVSHEVTNVVSDRVLLSKQAAKAKIAMGRDTLDVYADRGYFSGAEIMACKANGVTGLCAQTAYVRFSGGGSLWPRMRLHTYQAKMFINVLLARNSPIGLTA